MIRWPQNSDLPKKFKLSTAHQFRKKQCIIYKLLSRTNNHAAPASLENSARYYSTCFVRHTRRNPLFCSSPFSRQFSICENKSLEPRTMAGDGALGVLIFLIRWPSAKPRVLQFPSKFSPINISRASNYYVFGEKSRASVFYLSAQSHHKQLIITIETRILSAIVVSDPEIHSRDHSCFRGKFEGKRVSHLRSWPVAGGG